MRAGKGIAVVLAAGALLVPAAGEAAVYDPVGECVPRGGTSDYRSVARRGGDYVVLGNRRTREAAERSARIIREERFWEFLSARYDPPPRDPAPGGGVLPLQIFVTNEDFDAGGSVLSYCEAPTSSDVVLIAFDLDGVELRSTLVHELFHAFSDGESAPAFVEGWWAEATATYAEVKQAPSEAQIRRLDREFLQRPLVPIDRELDDPAWDERSYGAWRFLEFVTNYLGGEPAAWEFMAGTFRRVGAGVTGTVALQKELEANGRDLGEDLGTFWGERLGPSNPLAGPATEGGTDGFSVDPVEGGGDLTEAKPLTAKRLAADVVRYKLPPDSHVQRVTVTADPAPPGTYLWVQNGSELEDWTRGDSASYCVGGYSPTTGAKAWPDRLPVAFTNGLVAPTSPPITHTLRFTVSAEECEGFVRDPSAAVDDSPVLELPDRCPDAPEDFPAPDEKTDYYVFGERLKRAYETMSTWVRAAVAEISRRDLGQRAAGRLIARWLYCTARRVRELDAAPDGRIDTWRDQLVSRIRGAARVYESGRLFSGATAIGRTGAPYGKIQVRCTTLGIDPGTG